MKIEEGPWRGWEVSIELGRKADSQVWLEFTDGRRLSEPRLPSAADDAVEHDHKYTSAAPGSTSSEVKAQTMVECEHEKVSTGCARLVTQQDFKIVVKAPPGNHRDFHILPSIDGSRIQGLAGQCLSFLKRYSIRDRLEVVADGSIVLKSLRFMKLVGSEVWGQCADVADLGRGTKGRQACLGRRAGDHRGQAQRWRARSSLAPPSMRLAAAAAHRGRESEEGK